ncbi:hypothetical protein BH20ACI4_BH20ACI4_17890 [soil metagenome]
MRNFRIIFTTLALLSLAGCQQSVFKPQTVTPTTLRDVPAQRLNYRFEPDVPAPTEDTNPQTQERNAAVQTDFDQNRPLQVLYKTLASPDKQRILAIYNKIEDSPTEYRLDMYSADGKLLRRVTPSGMAVHFPDTIIWSPDSTALAFVAMVRAGNTSAAITPESNNSNTNSAANSNTNSETNSNANSADANTPPEASPQAASTANLPEPPPVLTFRTEQIYLCNSDGDGLKPLTQNEGLIYYYYAWSPDGSSLAALAAKFVEWRYLQAVAEQKGEVFVPYGRPRLIEKSGRERRLDDAPTQVRPVWSPDSAKVAVAYDKQVRIYDAIGETPTQAGIVLRNELLRSSQLYDQQQQLQQESNTNGNANGANANVPNPISTPADNSISTLPDEGTLVSFNPIIGLDWEQDSLLYLQTGYVREFKSGEGSRSYLRWHRLALSPQAVALGNSK